MRRSERTDARDWLNSPRPGSAREGPTFLTFSKTQKLKGTTQAMTDTDQKNQAQATEDTRSQASYDTSFGDLVGGPTQGGLDFTQQVVASYFEMLEHHEAERRTQYEATTRQARKMSDLWAQDLILRQTTTRIVQAIVPAVKRQVIEELRQTPEFREIAKHAQH